MKKLKIVYVDGYWKNNGEKFQNYKSCIGEDKGLENDNDIFFYFSSESDIKTYTQDNNGNEFVITKYTIEK